MRISGGTHRGQKLNVPKGDRVRPASDKVRQAVFNMLKSYSLPDDAVVLDVFCGTGAYGLEALSRGARLCIFMDRDIKACRANIEALKLESASQIMRTDALKPAPRTNRMPAADLLFLDPPYHQGFLDPALDHLIAGGWLAPDGIIVMEMAKDDNLPRQPVEILKDKEYGDTRLIIVRRTDI